MAFQTYSDDNPPKRGNAKILFDAFKQAGLKVSDLHYNPNNWGRQKEDGYGTWACAVGSTEFACPL